MSVTSLFLIVFFNLITNLLLILTSQGHYQYKALELFLVRVSSLANLHTSVQRCTALEQLLPFDQQNCIWPANLQ